MINPSPCSWGGPQWLWQWGGNPRGLRLCDACAVGTRGGAQETTWSSFSWALNIFTHTHRPRGIGCLGFLQFSWYILNCWKKTRGRSSNHAGSHGSQPRLCSAYCSFVLGLLLRLISPWGPWYHVHAVFIDWHTGTRPVFLVLMTISADRCSTARWNV